MSGADLHDRHADREARRAACRTFDRALVVEAGAGTGKTTALVARIVSWSLGPGWTRAEARLRALAGSGPPEAEPVAAEVLRRVVAITFTEAAAAEMAGRVADALGTLVAGGAPEGIGDDALPPAPQRVERARALLATLDRLVVRTIHAFARRLLASHPIEAGLRPDFEVDADGLAASAAARRTLEECLADAWREPGDPVLLALAARGVGPAELEETLLVLLDDEVDPALLADDPFAADRLESLRATLAQGVEALCKLEGGRFAALARQNAPGTMDGLRRLLAQLAEGAGEGVAGILRLQAHVLDALDEKQLDVVGRWARGVTGASERDGLGKQERARLGEDDAPAFEAAAAALWPGLSALARIDAERLHLARCALGPLLERVRERLQREGLVSFQGLLERARRLLERHPEVAAQERREIDLLLVDEFQDTDREQCALVGVLACEGAPEERPRLFVVGDPKQSIYAWRNAELEAYEGFCDRVLAGGGASHALVVNHRSVAPVLAEVERVIRPAMIARAGLQPAFQALHARRSEAGEHGFAAGPARPVEHWISTDPAADRTRGFEAAAFEARALARDVARLVREDGVAPRDIGILFRGLNEVEPYLAALREAGIPYDVASDRRFYRRREIVDAAALVRCVIDPLDPVALVAFLRSSVVGVPDAALVPLWKEGLPRILAALGDGSDLAPLAAAARAAAAALPDEVPGLAPLADLAPRLVRAGRVLAHLRRRFARDAAPVFVEELRRLFLLEVMEAARPLGAFRVANLERFFRELERALDAGADAAEVLRALRRAAEDERESTEGSPREAALDAVQVMSIHKAKGLGFRHVYLLQLHKRGRGGPPRPAVVSHAGHTELCLLGQRSPGFGAVETRRAEIEACEQVRTLYVAMTRARDRLVMAGAWHLEGRRSVGTPLGLVAGRAGTVPDLASLAARLRAEGRYDHVDDDGVRWHFPALEEASRQAAGAPAREIAAPEEPGGAPVGPRAAAREQETLAHEAIRARRRAERRFGGAASWAAHQDPAAEEMDDAATPAPPRNARPGRDRAVAQAVGTAVHRALELLAPEGPGEEPLARACSQAERTLAGLLPEARRDEAVREARALLRRFFAGPLHSRLCAIAPGVLARELPVLLPPAEASGPVGYTAGAVDLVYRDPESGATVVADYKTDAAPDAERCRRYALQGAAYVRAVQEALGLAHPPRFELWWLAQDRIEEVALAPSEA